MSRIRGKIKEEDNNNTPEYDFLVEANELATEVNKCQPQLLSTATEINANVFNLSAVVM